MKTKISIYFICLAFLSIFFISCDSNDPEPVSELDNYTILAEQQIPGTTLTAKIYQENDSLFVGYNRLEIVLTKAGVKGDYTDAEIVLKPMMDMGTMKHACPIENPVAGKNIEGVFGGAVVFVMPSGDMGSWMLTIEVKDDETEESGKLDLPVIIKMPEESRMKSFSMGTDKYFVSYVQPSEPLVGINDFEVTVHKKATMMEWPASGDFTISMEPEMPDMGHGSPNNVNPVLTADGHYKGKVNFTMDGYWKINLALTIGDQTQAIDFDVTF
ncbi:MAG: FixH family protein [Cyclobacteriaceae bacterium]|nr:FixH family protein [Cyclobacteriaceae bacterium]